MAYATVSLDPPEVCVRWIGLAAVVAPGLVLPQLALVQDAGAQDAGDLPAIAQSEGFAAVAKLAEQAVEDLGPKSGARMLELSGLKRVRFPVEVRGALAVAGLEVGAMSGFALEEGDLRGRVQTRPALGQAPAAACVNAKGKLVKAPLTVSADGEGWGVGGVLACWKGGGAWALLYAPGEDPKVLLKGGAGPRGEGPLSAPPEPVPAPPPPPAPVPAPVPVPDAP